MHCCNSRRTKLSRDVTTTIRDVTTTTRDVTATTHHVTTTTHDFTKLSNAVCRHVIMISAQQQRATSPRYRITSPRQRATSPRQHVTSLSYQMRYVVVDRLDSICRIHGRKVVLLLTELLLTLMSGIPLLLTRMSGIPLLFVLFGDIGGGFEGRFRLDVFHCDRDRNFGFCRGWRCLCK